MKNKFSNLLVGITSLAVIGATSLSIVSCGSTVDNKDKYILVLQRAIKQIITAKRQESGKIRTNKTSFTMSIDDIAKAAAKIIAKQKLSIATSYFKHLYLFGKFTPDPSASAKNVVQVIQNSKSRPTAITIIYDDSAFNKTISTTAEPESTPLGLISIDIKQRHLLVMKKSLANTHYKLSNTAYFDTTKSTWSSPNAPVGVLFSDGETGSAITNANIPKKWLAISQDPENFAKIIAVSAHGVWYSENAGKTFTSAFFKSLLTPMEFNSHGSATDGALLADSAKIEWGNNETAVIAINRIPNSNSYQPKTAKGWTTWNVAALGELMVARLTGAKNDIHKTDKVNTIAPVFYTGGFGYYTALANGFRLDKYGNLFWATTSNINEDLNYQGTYEMSAADIANVASGSLHRPTATVTAAGEPDLGPQAELLGMTISPDEKNLWTYWTSGYAMHNVIVNGKINPIETGYVETGEHQVAYQATTAIASNTGIYFISGGHDYPWSSTKGYMSYAGFVSNDSKVNISFTHVLTRESPNGFWSYGYNGGVIGKNPYEILSTGNVNQTYILNADNKFGEATLSSTGDFSGYAPYGTIINPDSPSGSDMGLVINIRNTKLPTIPGSIYWLPSDHSSLRDLKSSKYFPKTALSASFGEFGQLTIGNQVYDVNDMSHAPHQITTTTTTDGVAFNSRIGNKVYFKSLSENGISSINLTGVTITYKGSLLSWNAAPN